LKTCFSVCPRLPSYKRRGYHLLFCGLSFFFPDHVGIKNNLLK
jgi:hypothetical protein